MSEPKNMGEHIIQLEAELAAARALNAELLAALKEGVSDTFDAIPYGGDYTTWYFAWKTRCKALIARASGSSARPDAGLLAEGKGNGQHASVSPTAVQRAEDTRE
jgi:hypothetical protein